MLAELSSAGGAPASGMVISRTAIPGPLVIAPRRNGDERGWLAETFRAEALAQHGVAFAVIQENQSFSGRPGTIRGLHWQAEPAAQIKLISVVAGAILDVAVDLRRSSPHFGRHVALRLDAAEGRQLLVPVGFAHGFCVLEPGTLVTYKIAGSAYSPRHERGLAFDDPTLGIGWPVGRGEAILSAKDAAAPGLDAVECFR